MKCKDCKTRAATNGTIRCDKCRVEHNSKSRADYRDRKRKVTARQRKEVAFKNGQTEFIIYELAEELYAIESELERAHKLIYELMLENIQCRKLLSNCPKC